MTKFECNDCQYKNACNKIIDAKDDNNPICDGVMEHIDDIENEHRKDAKCQIHSGIAALLILLAMACGYIGGYKSACSKMCERLRAWEEMYDRHINGQWEMIQRRDTLYVKAIRLKLKYADGSELTPVDFEKGGNNGN